MIIIKLVTLAIRFVCLLAMCIYTSTEKSKRDVAVSRNLHEKSMIIMKTPNSKENSSRKALYSMTKLKAQAQ